MNKNQFLKEQQKHKRIWGFIYGYPIATSAGNYLDTIINISIDKLKICDDGLLYQWGFPGPDFNFYEYKNYGIFWAFEEKDINVEEAIKRVKEGLWK